MTIKADQHRLDFMTRQLSASEWRLLGALAMERELGLSKLARLASVFGVGAAQGTRRTSARAESGSRGLRVSREPEAPAPALTAQITEWVSRGLLIEVGRARGPNFARGGVTEPSYALPPELRQLVLRQIAARGDLAVVAEATQGALGERSLGAITLLLQAGRLGEFQRYAYSLPKASGRLAEELNAEELLRDTVLRPFDPAWFEAVWQREAVPAAERVLREALPQLHECDRLFDWLRGKLPPPAEPAASAADLRPFEVLCEHAVLRGKPELVEAYAPLLPAEQRLGFEAAAHFLHGDLAAAHALLDAPEPPVSEPAPALAATRAALTLGRRERDKKRAAPVVELGAAAPLLALIAYGRGTPRAVAEAKRWMAASTSDAGAERAVRTLLRYGSQPDSGLARLDVHQLAPGATAWELLILALTVHLHLEQEVTRAAWSVELVRSGAAWIEAGYGWFGRQALLLARALHADYFARSFEGVKARLFMDALEPRPGELTLAGLISPKPEWQRALEALLELAEHPTAEAPEAQRVAWYVDMTHGTLDRPALQRLEPGGWTRGRRLPLTELYALAHDLPPEDLAVLQRTQLNGEEREFAPDAIEALIGHPRVFNGARGGASVEVVRGTARIETGDDGGALTIRVIPRGARLGVNVTIESDTRLVVYRVTPALARVIEVLPDGLAVPKEREPFALEVLGRLSQGVEVQSRHLGADRHVEADSTPCLRVKPQAGAWLVQGGVRPFGARGRFFIAGTGRAALSLYAGGERLLCTRDLNLERQRLSRLILECPSLIGELVDDDGLTQNDSVGAWDFSELGLLELLSELRDASERFELEWPESEALKLRGTLTRKNLHGNLRRKKGWYLATGGIRIDDVTTVSLGELAEASIVGNGRFVRLASGDFVAIEDRIRRVMDALARVRTSSKDGEIALHPGALGALRALSELEGDAAAGGFAVDTETHEWLSRVESLETQTFAVPSTLGAVLRNYQLEGFQWLSRLSALGLGACLADDMGLGKTVQILAVLLTRLDAGPALVVAPTSVCANWLREAARFAPSLRTAEYAGPERAGLFELLKDPAHAPQLVVSSYGLLQQDVDALSAVQWGSVVLDEAQFIKNAESLRAKAACRLEAPFRIAATGTPVENHVGDLWSIFNFINPGLLGPWRTFKHRYVTPIERNGDEAVRAALKEQIKPFILRRTKSEVLDDLPPLTLVHHTVYLSEAEAQGYALLRRQIHDKLHTPEGRRGNKIEILAEITRLRRYCCHPRLVFPEASSDASKVQALLDLVLELRENQHRALVFSQFVDFLGLVRERFDENGVTYQYLDGSTPRAQRAERVEAFQAGEGTVFLISLKAGGFGLNLTAADYVIHTDPWWNPAVEAQATDRAHRIGQERPVTVYRLITKDTIEESIVELHQTKQALADALLEGGSEAGGLSARELVELIERDLAPPVL